jgi:membrane protease YdiL (CAAX protease family)
MRLGHDNEISRYRTHRTCCSGGRKWILNGLLWAVFHTAIGWRLALALVPLEFIVPYIVQKRRNTWIGVLVHGVYNGIGFILVALGYVS